MLKSPPAAHRGALLSHLGVVRVQGTDATRFLQGQLSNDLTKLAPGTAMLAGLHNPQGRAIAVLRLVLIAPDLVLAVVPAELVTPVVARLSKFVLRAKVKVSDGSAEWAVTAADAPEGAPTNSIAINAVEAQSVTTTDPSDIEAWRAGEIAAGMPQVYGATSEAFVAQMLNLDSVGGIAFDKGCYTGQEVIARAHYRGKVKRRMQRFRTAEAASLGVGDSGTLSDGRGFKVVDAVRLADGRTEFLAVAAMAAGADSEDAASTTPPGNAESAIAVESLPLPYPLPV